MAEAQHQTGLTCCLLCGESGAALGIEFATVCRAPCREGARVNDDTDAVVARRDQFDLALVYAVIPLLKGARQFCRVFHDPENGGVILWLIPGDAKRLDLVVGGRNG